MKGLALAGALLLAQAAGASEFGGQLRVRGDDLTTGQDVAVELQLRGQWRFITASGTLEHVWTRHAGDADASRVNELYAAGDAAGWTFSAGRRIVSWDVGWGFRPNDVVQQERRRTLLPVLLEGKAVAMAEWFGADDAWTLVAVDPTSSTREHAVAARGYRRAGPVDLHGFARQGEDTGSSLGAALQWVATESVELHASVRYAHEVDGRFHVPQALLGASWTGDSRLGVLVEAWYDGAAPSDAEWADPRTARVLAAGAATRQNQRRENLFLRLSWEHEGFEPALDVLWLPADRSHVTTASLGWRGDRLRLDGGVRRMGGPAGSVMGASPVRHIGYAAATWSF